MNLNRLNFCVSFCFVLVETQREEEREKERQISCADSVQKIGRNQKETEIVSNFVFLLLLFLLYVSAWNLNLRRHLATARFCLFLLFAYVYN